MLHHAATMDAKHFSLHTPSAFARKVDDSPSSELPSPIELTRPLEPIRIKTRPASPEPLHFEDVRDVVSEPHRSESVSSGRSDKEKRKRSRVTPEQLTHLERFFMVDRSPTAARRREISELLGMHERQTQIWFQNRRAKAKLQDSKQKCRGRSAEIPPDSPPQLSTGFEMDLHNLIHEDESVTIIPCTDLSIGTWRRIATTMGKHDLVAYVCNIRRCLAWFIYSAGFGFKMEIPFETIINTEFTNASPGTGLACFYLSEPPIFFLENISSPRADGSAIRYWKRCSDWTEGHQATNVLRHELVGSAAQLSHILQTITANAGHDIPLRQPFYNEEPPPSLMELPPPPMAGLTGPGYPYEPESMDTPHDDRVLIRKRPSYSGTSPGTHSPDSAYSNDSDRLPLHGASTGNLFSQHRSYTAVSHRGTPASSNFGVIRSDHMTDPYHDPGHHGHPLSDYTGMSVSHSVLQPHSAQPVPRTFYGNEVPQLAQSHPYDPSMRLRRSHSTVSIEQYYGQPTPSPPLLTTPYHPPSHLLQTTSNSGQHHT